MDAKLLTATRLQKTSSCFRNYRMRKRTKMEEMMMSTEMRTMTKRMKRSRRNSKTLRTIRMKMKMFMVKIR